MNNDNKKFEVALSYASENRVYVEKVYKKLREKKVNVYFDKAHEIDAWGEHSDSYFGEIFSKAKHCVAFISKYYLEKGFPLHELHNAIASEIQEKSIKVLPVKLDDVGLPSGLPKTKIWVNAQNTSPEQLAEMIIAKIKKGALPSSEKATKYKLPRIPRSDFDPYEEAETVLNYLFNELKKRGKELEKEVGIKFYGGERGEKKVIRATKEGKVLYSLNLWIDSQGWGNNTVVFNRDESIGDSINGWGKIEWSIEDNAPVIKLDDFSSFSSTRPAKIAKEKWADILWDELIQKVESQFK